ncbi:cyclodeaminase/cyclohydrolase family protein [Patescibacteria group bacterium]
MNLSQKTLLQIDQSISGKKSSLGGGSVAALSGFLAVSLVQKVLMFSLGKKRLKNFEKDFLAWQRELEKLAAQFLQLAKADGLAYQRYMKDKDNLARKKKLILVPLEIAQNGGRVLKVAKDLEEKGNQNLKSDSRVAQKLAAASVYGALEIVRGNLPLVVGGGFEAKIRQEIETLLKVVN